MPKTMAKLSEESLGLLKRWPLAAKFDLPHNAKVAVVGSYKGAVMQLLHEMYEPKIWGFEPQQWAVHHSLAREIPRAMAFPFGLSHEGTQVVTMGEWHTDACSAVNNGPAAREHGSAIFYSMEIVLEVMPFLRNLDLMVMNIEGYEFDLLPRMIELGWIKTIDRLAVQFHHGFGNDDESDLIYGRMASTHTIVHDDRPRWVYWTKEGIV